jgi:hypothetical protein
MMLRDVRLGHLLAWWLGFRECRSGFGRTWTDDQDKNEMYDLGRDLGQRLWRFEE